MIYLISLDFHSGLIIMHTFIFTFFSFIPNINTLFINFLLIQMLEI